MMRGLILRLAPRLIALSLRRPPDVVIGGAADPYMLRWWLLPPNRVFNIYLHHFLRSDDDRALHDHPWWNISVLLAGRYVEHTIAAGGVHARTERRAGEIKLRGARAAHRIELVDGPCWTVFLTGPWLRAWGFHCPQGWRHWREFTAGPRGETIGRVCGEDGPQAGRPAMKAADDLRAEQRALEALRRRLAAGEPLALVLGRSSEVVLADGYMAALRADIAGDAERRLAAVAAALSALEPALEPALDDGEAAP